VTARSRPTAQNARASTGPKTHGAALAQRETALRHGLSLPVRSDPALSEEVEMLAREIAGPDANTRIKELARRVAEAQIDLRRVRHARHQLLSNALSDPYYESRAARRAKLRLMCRLLRPNASEISMAALTKSLTSTPQGPDKFAIILSEEAKQLLARDRYERRTLFLAQNCHSGLFEERKQKIVDMAEDNQEL
jgi:hypothetical protein